MLMTHKYRKQSTLLVGLVQLQVLLDSLELIELDDFPLER